MVPNLNSWLSGIPAKDKEEFTSSSTRTEIYGYWTSSEFSLIYANKWYYIDDEGVLAMSRDSKHIDGNVRCAFAF